MSIPTDLEPEQARSNKNLNSFEKIILIISIFLAVLFTIIIFIFVLKRKNSYIEK